MSPSVRFNDDVFKGLNHALSSLSRSSSNHKSPILFKLKNSFFRTFAKWPNCLHQLGQNAKMA